MKERPILFSAPMVRAILSGSKMQTRRVVKGNALNWLNDVGFTPEFVAMPENHQCPYGQPGDRLWVREAWSEPTTLDPGPTFYRADYPDCVPPEFENVPQADQVKWKPSIHMRRDQSRILLEITAVRVERLNEISEADARAEGISEVVFRPDDGFPLCNGYMVGEDDGNTRLHVSAKAAYHELWESINGAGSWAADPWVWVVEFKRVTP